MGACTKATDIYTREHLQENECLSFVCSNFTLRASHCSVLCAVACGPRSVFVASMICSSCIVIAMRTLLVSTSSSQHKHHCYLLTYSIYEAARQWLHQQRLGYHTISYDLDTILTVWYAAAIDTRYWQRHSEHHVWHHDARLISLGLGQGHWHGHLQLSSACQLGMIPRWSAATQRYWITTNSSCAYTVACMLLVLLPDICGCGYPNFPAMRGGSAGPLFLLRLKQLHCTSNPDSSCTVPEHMSLSMHCRACKHYQPVGS
jgi:hypothetical protein